MVEFNKAALSEYNFIVAIDASGSMEGQNWLDARDISLAVANFAGQVDSDGIDIITFGATIGVHEKASAEKIPELFKTISPMGSTPLHLALNQAIEIKKRSSKKAFIVVVTDGVPDEEDTVYQILTNASNELLRDKDMSVLFIQVGDDEGATQFLASLDDNLEGKFDIVDYKTYDAFKEFSFEKLFTQAQFD